MANPGQERSKGGPSAVITRDPLSVDALLGQVTDPAHGAALLFLGWVRDHNDGRSVRGIRYEAYEEMARGVLSEILDEARHRWPGSRMAACHRVGELVVGEASIGVAVSTAHRAEAYEASRWVMEEVKVRLPVWKEERYVEGDAAWVAGSIPAARGRED